jgi:IS5 family transposase
MQTCKSPLAVLVKAYEVARRGLPQRCCEQARHDFDLWQLFACLVLREHQKKSYRGIEALLRDAPGWCMAIGMSRPPDHSTLCRAFKALLRMDKAFDRLLDLMAQELDDTGELGHRLSIDSTHLERWHSSKYYDYRVAQSHDRERRSLEVLGRSETNKRMPKLGLGVDTASHLILSLRTRTGMGSDAPDFDSLLFDGWRRGKVKVVVADAGYDSEANHVLARHDMGVRSIIPARIGRPTAKEPSGYWRRVMKRRFKRKADKKDYGQRWQSETVNSMVKRNMGSSLRARTPEGREMELKLRAITHNIMLLANRK